MPAPEVTPQPAGRRTAKTVRNLLVLGLSSIALPGCIAAAALPIVAGGGALVRNGVSDDARPDGEVDIRNAAAADASSAPTPAPTPALAAAEPAPQPAAARPVEPTPAPTPAATITSEPVIDSTLADRTGAQGAAISPAATAPGPAAPPPEPAPEPAQVRAGQDLASSAPPVAARPAAASPATDRLSGRSAAQAALNMPLGEGYGALHGYAMRTLGEGLPMTSAMLADPTSLQPVRRECDGNAPTVVIDLDPEGGLVPLVGPLAVNNELARVLSDLRARDVSIAWITDRGPVDARAVRDRLVAAGLDPEASDALYVERYPGETKQARRAALSQTQCVIAVAGDTRADFDDLYNYLIDPDDARPLELLLGNGWFLIDNPVGG